MEIMLIFLAILLLFGAKRIPEIAKGLGKGIREFKQATQDISNEIQSASDSANRPRVIEPPRQAPVSRQDTAQQGNSSNSGTAAE